MRGRTHPRVETHRFSFDWVCPTQAKIRPIECEPGIYLFWTEVINFPIRDSVFRFSIPALSIGQACQNGLELSPNRTFGSEESLLSFSSSFAEAAALAAAAGCALF